MITLIILQPCNSIIIQFNIQMSEVKKNKINNKTKKIVKEENTSKNVTKNDKNVQSKQDTRFSKALYDPKFLAPSQKLTKIKIDKRFSKMMNDPSFRTTSIVDKHGRTIDKKDQNKQLEQYYYMDKEQEQIDEQQVQNQEEQSQPEEESKQKDGIRQWMQNYNEQSSQLQNVQYQDLDQQDIDEVWSQSQENMIKGQNVQATKRLALCNYDWMNINSKDLMILFNSFKTNAGYIKSIKVYMSNIGKEKLELQAKHGPQGIWKNTQTVKEVEPSKKKQWKKSMKELLKERDEQQNAFDEVKLRQYQKQRLRYFYAVIECDSKKSADEIYRQCDGNQFQSSNLPFDLRFIPDDIQFEASNLKEECNEMPVAGDVKNFINRALGHSKVSLTWQDPELSLAATLKKKNWNIMSEKQLDNVDWGAYINQEEIQHEDGFKKIVKENKEQSQMISDWKKCGNKKYRQDDDIEITFEGGFDKKIKQTQNEAESLNRQKKSMKERRRQNDSQKLEKKKQRQQLQLLVEDKRVDFNLNLHDQRFKAVYENPLYAIDPVDSKFDPRKSGKVFEQVVKRNKNKNAQ